MWFGMVTMVSESEDKVKIQGVVVKVCRRQWRGDAMDTLTLCGTPMIDRDIGLVWNNYNRWRWVNGDGVSGDGLEKLEMGAVV